MIKLLAQARFRRGVIAVRLHPSGRLAAAASNGGTVACWSLDRAGHLSPLWQWRLRKGTHNEAFDSIAFSPSGRFLAVTGMGGPVRLWRIRERARRFTIERFGHFDTASYSALFLEDHLLACRPTDDPRPVVFDIEGHRGFDGQLWSHFAALHPEGGLVLRSAVWPSATSDLTFAWWDGAAPPASEEELEARDPGQNARLVCAGPAGGRLSLTPPRLDVTDEEGGYTPVGPVAFHPLGDQFAALSGMPDRFFLQVFDFPGCRPLFQRRYPLTVCPYGEVQGLFDEELTGSWAERLLYLPNGQLLLPTPDGDMVVLESETGDEVERHRVQDGFLASVDYDPERQRLLTGGAADGEVKVWRYAPRRQRIARQSRGMCPGRLRGAFLARFRRRDSPPSDNLTDPRAGLEAGLAGWPPGASPPRRAG